MFKNTMTAMFLFVLTVVPVSDSVATWKPEYADNPAAVQRWFKEARTMPAAYIRLGIAMCCEQAERLMTKFIPAKSRDGADRWRYYTDEKCVSDGCPTKAIPDDIIHDEEIAPPKGWDEGLPEAEKQKVIKAFKQMQAEGILFIYKDAPSCFWPPESGG